MWNWFLIQICLNFVGLKQLNIFVSDFFFCLLFLLCCSFFTPLCVADISKVLSFLLIYKIMTTLWTCGALVVCLLEWWAFLYYFILFSLNIICWLSSWHFTHRAWICCLFLSVCYNNVATTLVWPFFFDNECLLPTMAPYISLFAPCLFYFSLFMFGLNWSRDFMVGTLLNGLQQFICATFVILYIK